MLSNLFEIVGPEWEWVFESFLVVFILFLISVAALWFFFWFLPAWHQKRKQSLPPLSSRDKALQIIRDVYVRLWKNQEMICIKNLGPALTLYLTDEFGGEQLQFNNSMIHQLKQNKKISETDADLLFQTVKMLDRADELEFPPRSNAMAIAWELQRFVGQSERPPMQEDAFRS